MGRLHTEEAFSVAATTVAVVTGVVAFMVVFLVDGAVTGTDFQAGAFLSYAATLLVIGLAALTLAFVATWVAPPRVERPGRRAA